MQYMIRNKDTIRFAYLVFLLFNYHHLIQLYFVGNLDEYG